MEIGLLLLVAAVYFFPWLAAAGRGHHQAGAIFALNLLLGWTGLGWIAAFVWACTATAAPASGAVDPYSGLAAAPPPPATPEAAAAKTLDELERLARLKAEGALNDEEFAALKAKAIAPAAARAPAPDAY